MKYYLNCKFIKSSLNQWDELISISLVSEDGRKYYAINYDCDWSKASNWVKDNVLAQLPQKPLPNCYSSAEAFRISEDYKQGWRNKGLIADEIIEFCNPKIYGKPEFWIYYPNKVMWEFLNNLSN